MTPSHHRETSGLELYLGVRRHVEAQLCPYRMQSAYDHGLDSFGVLCSTCGSSWMISEVDWNQWIEAIPFEHAQLIRVFLKSPALDELLGDIRPYTYTLPEKPAPPDAPPPKSIYARLLEDDEAECF